MDMNIPLLREEKKVDDHINDDDTGRIERLERLIELLCQDVYHMKEQQMRSQKQVLDLQADLAAAELAREAAEQQMGQMQMRDHSILLSLVAKQQEQQKTVIKIPHHHNNISAPSISRCWNTKTQDTTGLIDVTNYEENIAEYDNNEVAYHVDDIQDAELSSCSVDLYTLQLWEDLSLSIQHLSSDLVKHRDAMEFAFTNFQLTMNQRMTATEDTSAKQLGALKAMAIEWDKKLQESNEQIQNVNNELNLEKKSTTKTNTETTTKLKHLDEQLLQIQSSVQRHSDYNQCLNGKELVMKREQEMQFQKLHKMIQNLNRIIQEQANQICTLQPTVPTTATYVHNNNVQNLPTSLEDSIPDETLPADDFTCVEEVDDNNINNARVTVANDNENLRQECDRATLPPPIMTKATDINTMIVDSSSIEQHHSDDDDDDIQKSCIVLVQRCQSF